MFRFSGNTEIWHLLRMYQENFILLAVSGHNPIAEGRRGYGVSLNESNVEEDHGAFFSNSLHRKATTALATFNPWLAERGEHRRMEELPPEKLDEYLVMFFKSLKKQNGTDYLPNSLKALRTGMVYYLKTCGYPESIARATTFARSQQAFRQKLMEVEAVYSGTGKEVTALNAEST